MKWFVHFECEKRARTVSPPVGKTIECPGHYNKGKFERHIAFPYMAESNG